MGVPHGDATSVFSWHACYWGCSYWASSTKPPSFDINPIVLSNEIQTQSCLQLNPCQRGKAGK